jgi:hypothetical protein
MKTILVRVELSGVHMETKYSGQALDALDFGWKVAEVEGSWMKLKQEV